MPLGKSRTHRTHVTNTHVSILEFGGDALARLPVAVAPGARRLASQVGSLNPKTKT